MDDPFFSTVETQSSFPGAALLVIIFLLVIFGFWFFGKKKRVKNTINQVNAAKNLVFLKILVPKGGAHKKDEIKKDYKETISVFEPLLDSIATLFNKPSLFKNTPQPTFSLEILAKSGEIFFYVVTPNEYKDLIERQIHSIYPSAQIEVNKDFHLFAGEEKPFDAASIELNRSFMIPIKTYPNIELDSLNPITNALSKLGHSGNGGVQVLIRPRGNDWQKKIESALSDLMDGKDIEEVKDWKSSAGGFLGDIGKELVRGGGASSEKPSFENKGVSPKNQLLVELLKEKITDQALDVQVRCVTSSESEMEAKSQLNNLISAFGQFNSPDRNSFKVNKRKPKNIITDYIYRRFSSAPALVLNTKEIASIFHLPNEFVDTPNIAWLGSRKLSPPANLPQEGIKVGESVYRGETRPIYIQPEDRIRHLFMIGKTGVGKTVLFENMIEQDIKAGHGVCYIDPNGDAIEWILSRIPKERAEDVIYFNPSDTARPFGLNLLEWKRPEDKDFLVQEAVSMFYKLFDPNQTGIVGPQFEHWLRNAALTLMSNPEGGTLVEIPRLFVDAEFERASVSHVTDPVVKAFWEKQMAQTSAQSKSEMLNYFVSKFGRFMTNDMMRNIIGQPKSSFDFRDVMDNKKILLVNLSKGLVGEVNSHLLGMIIVSKLQLAAFSRQDTPEREREPFYLYVDEFQNFTSDTFATILSEARKYKLSLNITNQYIAQLTEDVRDAVVGNVGTSVVFRVGASDAEFLTNEFDQLTVNDMTNIDKRYFYIKTLIDGAPTEPFTGRSSDWSNDGNTKLADALKELSRLKYGKDGQAVSEMILKRSRIDQIPIDSNKEKNQILS